MDTPLLGLVLITRMLYPVLEMAVVVSHGDSVIVGVTTICEPSHNVLVVSGLALNDHPGE
jgi:hypothetical protein